MGFFRVAIWENFCVFRFVYLYIHCCIRSLIHIPLNRDKPNWLERNDFGAFPCHNQFVACLWGH